MITTIYLPEFDSWLERLKDRNAVSFISHRLIRVAEGHLGDVKSVGDGVIELRVHYGPGYRIYVLQEHRLLIVCLCGGDKGSQARDIIRARELAKRWKNKKT